MQALTAVELAVLAVVVLAALLLAAVTVRRRVLQRRAGTIELSLRLAPAARGRGWVLGVGRFEGDALRWWRVFSLAPRPRRSLSRQDLVVRGRRDPQGPESYALLKGTVVMECDSSLGEVELAMDSSAVTGFLAWLESRPPGATLPR